MASTFLSAPPSSTPTTSSTSTGGIGDNRSSRQVPGPSLRVRTRWSAQQEARARRLLRNSAPTRRRAECRARLQPRRPPSAYPSLVRCPSSTAPARARTNLRLERLSDGAHMLRWCHHEQRVALGDLFSACVASSLASRCTPGRNVRFSCSVLISRTVSLSRAHNSTLRPAIRKVCASAVPHAPRQSRRCSRSSCFVPCDTWRAGRLRSATSRGVTRRRPSIAKTGYASLTRPTAQIKRLPRPSCVPASCARWNRASAYADECSRRHFDHSSSVM